ncbi:hypothetical protein DFP72DRAFT_816061, partial [Ephemerocybe angulata]
MYGTPKAFYGTVEQQGRLTLHLHIMLWIAGGLSPQDVRDRLLNKDGVFQKSLFAYMESAHQGEFSTGTLEEPVDSSAKQVPHTSNAHYVDPTMTLPAPPPAPLCDNPSSCEETCPNCLSHLSWWETTKKVIDDIVLRSNVHTCSTHENPKAGKGCLDKDGICKARFPRELVPKTTFDEADGRIKLKKLEAVINSYTPLLTYLLRCNSDVTCMMSGTTMKAVILYVTDYITKVNLKSH